MFILRAIGRFFARIGRWIKETAWIQPLLIVGGIFAIIFSIPYITKWVGSWFSSESAAEKFYSSYETSLKKAEEHKSDVDKLFDYLDHYEKNTATQAEKNTYGEKFFIMLVQESCSSCEERYGGFKALKENWGKGSFDNLDGEFKLHTIYVDSVNSDGDNLFEEVYNRDVVSRIFEDTISYMGGEYGEHPYKENGANASNYVNELNNLTDPKNISTPTLFLIDLTDKAPAWTSTYGVREVLFNFEYTDGSDDIARARTLRNAWTNDWMEDSIKSTDNVFSSKYKAS